MKPLLIAAMLSLAAPAGASEFAWITPLADQWRGQRAIDIGTAFDCATALGGGIVAGGHWWPGPNKSFKTIYISRPDAPHNGRRGVFILQDRVLTFTETPYGRCSVMQPAGEDQAFCHTPSRRDHGSWTTVQFFPRDGTVHRPNPETLRGNDADAARAVSAHLERLLRSIERRVMHLRSDPARYSGIDIPKELDMVRERCSLSS